MHIPRLLPPASYIRNQQRAGIPRIESPTATIAIAVTITTTNNNIITILHRSA